MGIAITGIGVPMALSFALESLAGATPLQAFTAGAALCATSLGTTFTVLGTSGLTSSRLGVVLTSAAMMDDIVGLVMVQVVSNLGGAGNEISAAIVIRPILVSLGFVVITPLICAFAVKPLTEAINKRRKADPNGPLHKLLCKRQTTFLIETLILIGLITASSYSGSSNLFASYIAGAAISWWDSEIPHVEQLARKEKGNEGMGVQTDPSPLRPEQNDLASALEGSLKPHFSGLDVFHTYYRQPLERVFKPLFFV
jgi:Kef-type K+ transport system membrane component KefB